MPKKDRKKKDTKKKEQRLDYDQMSGHKKEEKRERTSERTPKWKRDLLNPPELKTTFISLAFDGMGNIYLQSLEQRDANSEKYQAYGQADWDNVIALRRANRNLLDKYSLRAMTTLFQWGKDLGLLQEGDCLSPDDQRDLLDDFIDAADVAIKRKKFEKRKYDTANEAYKHVRPKMVVYRAKQGLPIDAPLSKKQSKELWGQIRKTKRWADLAKKHGKAHELPEKSWDDALRRAMNHRWEKDPDKSKK